MGAAILALLGRHALPIGLAAAMLLSATAALKLPLTTCYDEYRSGWDFSLGLTGRCSRRPGQSRL